MDNDDCDYLLLPTHGGGNFLDDNDGYLLSHLEILRAPYDRGDSWLPRCRHCWLPITAHLQKKTTQLFNKILGELG